MLEIKFISQNLSKIKQALSNRRDTADLETFSKAEPRRREILLEIEALRHERNVASDEIAKIKIAGGDADDRVRQMRDVAAKIKKLDADLAETNEIIESIAMMIPNMPHSSTPVGNDESENTLIHTEGTPTEFDFEPKPHHLLGENLKMFDFKRAAKIAGARFPLYMGIGAKLERALINFMLDIHTCEHGYQEVLPPFIVNRESMTGTGQLPKFSEDIFELSGLDKFLIPTAEVPVTNIHRGEILNEGDMPILYTAYTPCFRSEAGSYGKDTKGLIRQRQFNKVELVKFALPETSYDELEKLLKNAEEILKRLTIPYRVVALCTGDLGFSAAKTYDIEVWMPSQGVYREISSCSNFEDFQARRANIRFKRDGKKKTEFVHTLNGSGLAVGRTVAAILENFQEADGSIIIPKALRPHMGGVERIAL